ncbi:MAG: YebC/PmpR family DNA-binding transcriptional regulator [Acidimicrobiia bacterium]|jgi:YebC/PmpR family DNA-binding regulatory protein|nr:YebC/PmpR family DNA-binding transcriptional regulator [Acidimicrobiia bacterium]MBP8181780.1 YebC/PmpR family DNA-binding transcriptional regulator [Acidimicrobiia bacterium]
MSGHSKWSTIKHKKGAADAARGKLFAKLLRQVEVAAREGGGDIEGNPTLRTMVAKCREASVPTENITRAIKRGTGELEGVTYEAITYEGYAPAGVAMLVEVLTDNRNRAAAEIKNIFSRNGGSLAEPGAVAWQFERQGIITVDGSADEDALMEAALEAGAQDVVRVGDQWHVTTDPSDAPGIHEALVGAGFANAQVEVTRVAQNNVELTDPSDAKKVLRLLDSLEDHDDVQNVYANFDASDEVMEAATA